MSGPGLLGLGSSTLRWLAGGVVAMLLLAGCSGDEPGAQAPKPRAPSTSPVATSSPEPTPPAIPPAARRNTKAGAVAFAHHFLEVLNYTSDSGDVTTLKRVSLRSCTSCRNVADAVSQIYGSGGFVRRGELSADRSSALPGGKSETWTVGLHVVAEPQVIQSTASSTPRRLKGGEYSVTIGVQRSGQSWRIARMERVR